MGKGVFPLTRPSVVTDLVSDEPNRRARSVEQIARGYWQPIYRYLRLRWTASPDEAQDLTQSFFSVALDREALSQYQPGKGRFRTFLRTCLDRHVIDERRKAATQRRGGASRHYDVDDIEAELATCGHVTDPAASFDAEWLRHLLRMTIERLDTTFRARGKPVHAALFRAFHVDGDAPSYGDAAAAHAITVTDVTNWLHVARREFRRIALDLLRELTASEDEFAEEARTVFGIELAE